MKTSAVPAPIALFVYARPDHTRRTVEALLRNPEALEHDLIVFSDAARTVAARTAVDDVRSYLRTVVGFRSVAIRERPHNFGLAKSIIDGVSEVLSQYERVIVLEDDMVTSPHFLRFMDDGLERYAADDRVISIHGYVYPLNGIVPESFFLRGADCWGWATWRRGWECFNPDGAQLLGELKRRRLLYDFDFDGAYPYSVMLQDQVEGRNDSWAIRWYASAFLAEKLTLYPGRSLVHNIGNDETGTHCGRTKAHDVMVSSTPIVIDGVDVCPSAEARRAFETFFRGSHGGRMRSLRYRIFAFFRLKWWRA